MTTPPVDRAERNSRSDALPKRARRVPAREEPLDTKTLVQLYADLGRQVAAQTDVAGALGAVTAVAVLAVPKADHASITQGTRDTFRTVASTGEPASATDRLQCELGSGPCIDAVVKDNVFCSGDLTTDRRWPEFGPAAVATAGMRSVLSVRLVLDDDLAAALNLYSAQVDAFGETAMTAATVLATHGALAVAHVAALHRAAQLEQALHSNRQIGMAMGVLMAQHKLTEDQAFDLLRITSQHRNRKLAELARDVIDTGTIEFPLPRTPRRKSGR